MLVLLVGAGCGGDGGVGSAVSGVDEAIVRGEVVAILADLRSSAVSGALTGQDLETHMLQTSQELLDTLAASNLSTESRRTYVDEAINSVLSVNCTRCAEILRAGRP